MKTMKASHPLLLTIALALGGCAVVPATERDYGYMDEDRDYVRETIIVAPAPRIEYRGYPPATSYIWIDGYWNRSGMRHDWVSGYWAPPRLQARPPLRHDRRERERGFEPQRESERDIGPRRDRDHAAAPERQRIERHRDFRERMKEREATDDRRDHANQQPPRPTAAGPVTLGERREWRPGARRAERSEERRESREDERTDRPQRALRAAEERRNGTQRPEAGRSRFRPYDRE
jgi:hypothetical protein